MRNIGYPDWIADDDSLVEYYKMFPVDPGSSSGKDLIEAIFAINMWSAKKAWEPLAWTDHTNRTDFGAVPNIVSSFEKYKKF